MVMAMLCAESAKTSAVGSILVSSRICVVSASLKVIAPGDKESNLAKGVSPAGVNCSRVKGTVGSSLPRTRAGAFAGFRDPRFSAGAEWDTRKDARETGANTLVSPRVEVDSTGRLIAGFATIKPFQLLSDKSTFPLGLIARWDRFKPNTDTDAYTHTDSDAHCYDNTNSNAIANRNTDGDGQRFPRYFRKHLYAFARGDGR